MRKVDNRKIYVPTVVFIIILGIWEMAVRISGIPLYILPAPSKIFYALIAERNMLFMHGMITLKETAIGLVIAVIAGIILAIVMDKFELFRTATYPIMVVSQTVPVIVLAPIFIIYLGFGMAPKILIVVLMCFFPIVINFADGMKQVDINQINLARLFGAGSLRTYSMVKIPAAAPSLFSGLKVAATYSITGAVVGEWLSSDSGLGYYMLRLKNGYMLDKVFACVVVIVLLSLFMNGCVKLLQYILMPNLRKN
ncbi:ABC transporter permease [Aminipila terrae]|uniref:ABC transporter permease subunit n=1 Tax=Aminipila terrae TaxID=2697030 RepID=A0A6P1MCM4_9FIRM|nr:ABC transporter permease [Aminipila terrae]QHI71591.1 ABC transporter permease subunit [Aminipila terrae]